MEELLPGLIQTAKNIATQSLPEGSVTPEMDAEMNEFVAKTTNSLLSGGGEGLGGLGNIFGSLLGGGPGLGGGGGPGLSGLISSLGGGAQQNASNIYEYVEVEMPDFFRNTEHTVKFLAKYLDTSINAIRKKKKKITVTLEAGSPDGHVIEVAGQGHYDQKTRKNGNLFITFRTRRTVWNDYFRRSGQDLHITFPIESFREDSFEFVRTIPHPSGRILEISKSATNPLKPFCIGASNDNIVIPNFGFPSYHNTPCGNLVISLTFLTQHYQYIPSTMDFVYNGKTSKDLVSKIPARYITDSNVIKISNDPSETLVINNDTNTNNIQHVLDSDDIVEELQEVEEIDDAVEELSLTLEELD
jgi:hypothetical protein